MKLATYSADGQTRTGIVVGDSVIDTGIDGTRARGSVAASIPVDADQQVRCAICYRWGLPEVLVGVYHAQKLNHPLHLVQVAYFALQRREQVQHRLPGGGVAVVDGQIAPHFARVRKSAFG